MAAGWVRGFLGGGRPGAGSRGRRGRGGSGLGLGGGRLAVDAEAAEVLWLLKRSACVRNSRRCQRRRT